MGLFLLNEITSNLGIPQQQFGLYRDDGLMVLRASKRELDNLRKKLVGLFGKYGLKITTETGMISVDFLDVTVHLTDNSFEPFRKDEGLPVYVNKR